MCVFDVFPIFLKVSVSIGFGYLNYHDIGFGFLV